MSDQMPPRDLSDNESAIYMLLRACDPFTRIEKRANLSYDVIKESDIDRLAREAQNVARLYMTGAFKP